jgi:hypothetical protein
MSNFKSLKKTETNQSCINDENKTRLNSRNVRSVPKSSSSRLLYESVNIRIYMCVYIYIYYIYIYM